MSRTITTTAGEAFTYEDHQKMARLVFRRFGRDSTAALAAWRRLLENNCTLDQFLDLVGRDWMDGEYGRCGLCGANRPYHQGHCPHASTVRGS